MRIVFVALLSCCAGCASCQIPPSPGTDAGPPPVYDAAMPDAGECVQPGVYDDCARAGERVCMLGCRDVTGAPLWRTPAGTPFAETCRRALADGRNWHPACLAIITNCGQVEAAYRGTSCNP